MDNKLTSNQTALITGASSGIGFELAKLFANDNYNIIIISKNEAELSAAKLKIEASGFSSNITIIAKDLSQHGAAEELYADVKARNIQIDVLVNDAGVGNYGLFVDTDLKADVDMIHLNVIALMSLTKLFLKDMVARNHGKILQLGSVASFVPHPWLGVYAATKAFVLSFSESLQHELKDSDVKITVLCPGATDTNFFATAGAEESKVVNNTELDDPAKVAKEGYDALQKGEKRIIIGLKNNLQIAASNLIPDSMVAAMMANQLEPVSQD